MAAIKGYHRRRGWQAWHIAWLGRTAEFPALHELTGVPVREETDEERAERHFRNSMAWAIVTGGNAEPAESET